MPHKASQTPRGVWIPGVWTEVEARIEAEEEYRRALNLRERGMLLDQRRVNRIFL